MASETIRHLIHRHYAQHEMQELLTKLIAIPSCGTDNRYEAEVAHALKQYMNENGIPCVVSEIAENRYNLSGTYKGKQSTHRLLLTGHLDTVGDYGFPALFSPRVEDQVIYGRGACDMKGPIAAMCYGLVLMKRLGLEPEYDIDFVFVADEEMKSLGTEALIRSGYKADAAILGEPTQLKVCLGNRGLEWIDFVFKGRGSHGGTPEKGINAIEMAVHFINRIEKHYLPVLKGRTDPQLGPSMMNIGKISGGHQPSTIPEECLISVDRRWIPQERLSQVFDEYQEILDDLARDIPGFKAEMRRHSESMHELDHVPYAIEKNESVVKALEDAYVSACGVMPEHTAFPGWTDGSLLTYFGGIPTVIYGPGNIADAHSEHEKITLNELEIATSVYILAAMTWRPDV